MLEKCSVCDREIIVSDSTCSELNELHFINLEKYDQEDFSSIICDRCYELYKDLDVKSEINQIKSYAAENVRRTEEVWITLCKHKAKEVHEGRSLG